MPILDRLADVQHLYDARPAAKTVDGAFEFTRRLAWALRGEGCGLLQKGPGGENEVQYQGTSYAAARVCYPNGQIYKVLTDVPTTNGPTWSDNGTVEPSRYRPALPVDDASAPQPATTLDAIVRGLIESAVAPFHDEIAALKAEVAALKAQKPIEQPPLSLDGRRIALKTSLGHYICEDRDHHETPDRSANLLANRDSAGEWETFTIEDKH